MLLVMPEDAAAVLAEREAEARRIAAAIAWERAAGRSGPGVTGALKLLARELLWALVGIDVPTRDHQRPSHTLRRTAPHGAR